MLLGLVELELPLGLLLDPIELELSADADGLLPDPELPDDAEGLLLEPMLPDDPAVLPRFTQGVVLPEPDAPMPLPELDPLLAPLLSELEDPMLPLPELEDPMLLPELSELPDEDCACTATDAIARAAAPATRASLCVMEVMSKVLRLSRRDRLRLGSHRRIRRHGRQRVCPPRTAGPRSNLVAALP